MKILAIYAAVITIAFAFELPEGELKADNIVVTAGNPEGRITRGSKARLGQFPYMVGLLLATAKGGQSWCGGSLISNTKVLTAAHCIDKFQYATVYLGGVRRLSGEITHKVTSNNFIIHPGWNKERSLHDIAIIDIPYTAYSRNIQPVKIPPIGNLYYTYEGVQIVAAGWGRLNDISDNLSPDLQFIHAFVVSNELCRIYYHTAIHATTMCIHSQIGASICLGDSGGPLVWEATNTQIALNSFVYKGTCQQGVPTGSTRLTGYLDWIRDKAGVSY